MTVYEGNFLQIQFEKENDCFVQFWKKSPEDYSSLKKEFKAYTRFYLDYKPSYALWIQKNFKLPIDIDMHRWIEDHVTKPCVENGNQKVAFVVGEDVLVHLSVMSYFEEASSVIHPLHFATEKEARQWLNGTDQKLNQEIDIKILFEGVDHEGNSIIKIKRSSSDIKNTILSFGNLLEENNFIKSNISKFSRLTKREKEIMVHLAQGLRQQEVADELYISIQTVKTHWKNIKKKLSIKSLADVIKYVNAFEMK